MSRFVGNRDDFRKPGEARRLVVTSDLLSELGVANSRRKVQQDAVRRWLASNQPPKVLAASLRAAGFMDQPGERAAG